MAPDLSEKSGLRIAVEGCVLSPGPRNTHIFIANFIQGHGTLHAIYAAVGKACEARQWDTVDLLIIGGDFQVYGDDPTTLTPLT